MSEYGVFSGSYFPALRKSPYSARVRYKMDQDRIWIFSHPYLLSLYRKIGVRENPYSGIFYRVNIINQHLSHTKSLQKILTTKNSSCSKADSCKNISQKFFKLHMINTIISLSQNEKIENRKQFITIKSINSESFIFCLLHRTSEDFS